MQQISEFPRYMIGTDGTVYSCIVGRGKKATNSGVPQREIRAVRDTTGYLVVNLTDGERKVNRAIHRLLAVTYIPNPNSLPHVNHKDGDKLNNQLSNLEWTSAGTNTRHAIDMGMTDPRTRHPAMAQVIQQDLLGNSIRTFLSLHDAERMTGVAWQNISKVCRGLRKTAGGFRWTLS
jgi:hypothetical protein